MCVCVCVCMYVCMYMHRNTRLHTHTHTHTRTHTQIGALLGSVVIYTIPAMMYRRARKAELSAAGTPAAPLGADYHISGALIPSGIFLSLLGATIVVLKALRLCGL